MNPANISTAALSAPSHRARPAAPPGPPPERLFSFRGGRKRQVLSRSEGHHGDEHGVLWGLVNYKIDDEVVWTDEEWKRLHSRACAPPPFVNSPALSRVFRTLWTWCSAPAARRRNWLRGYILD